jgi:hypothetical protein
VKKQAVNLVLPDKSIRSLVTDEEGRLVDPPLEWPGIYKIETSQNTELLRFAVNMPPAESDLTFMPPAELQQQIVRSAPQANRTLTAGLFGDADQGKELWRVLLLAALAFLIFEPLLANKTAA